MIECEMGPEESLDEAIARLLEVLPEEESIWNSLNRRFKLDLICDVTVRGANQGFEIPPAVLQMISQRQITLGVDIFPKEDPEQAKGLSKVIGDS